MQVSIRFLFFLRATMFPVVNSKETSVDSTIFYGDTPQDLLKSLVEVRRERSFSCGSPGFRVRAGFILPHQNGTPGISDGESGELPPGPLLKPPSQGSLVTIFSIWNCMVSITIMAMPWAVAKAGLEFGICIIAFMALAVCYPLYLIFKCCSYVEKATGMHVHKFHEVCHRILGHKFAVFGLIVSLVNLLSDMVCYWIVLSNLLFQMGGFLKETQQDPVLGISENNSQDFIRPDAHPVVADYWNESISVPLYLAILLLPVVCLRYPTFFIKFSSVGIVSIPFLVIFILVKAGTWGIHMENDPLDFEEVKLGFPALSGTLFLGFLVHNVIVSITAYHNKPQHKMRDTGIAVILAALTFAVVGTVFYISFPEPKSKVPDNFLRYFPDSDVYALLARMLIFFQMFTMLPLLAFLFRAQFFYGLARRIDLGMQYIVLLNVFLVGICLAFASLFPKIGEILRYCGAFCGLVYVCWFPFVMDMKVAYDTGGKLYWRMLIFGLFLAFGISNIIVQFF